MSVKAIIARLDKTLRPLGFERRETTWNNKAGSFIDVVNLQTSKAGDSVTINVGVVNTGVYATFFGNGAPTFLEEPSCTVRARIGQLIGEKDVWWELDAADVPDEIADTIILRALPFLERMHSTRAMEQFLTDARVVKQKYPPPIIFLAILKHAEGDKNSGCALLTELKSKTTEAWQARINKIAERLSC